MGTFEVSESENNILGKTSCVVCTRHDPHSSHAIVNSCRSIRIYTGGGGNLGSLPPPKILACGHNLLMYIHHFAFS